MRSVAEPLRPLSGMGSLAFSSSAFERLRTLDPDDSMGWMGLAQLRRVAGDYAGAYELATEAVKRWDTNPAHLAAYGSLAAAVGQFDNAERAFDRILQLEPDGPGAESARRAIEQIREARRDAIRRR